MTFETAWHLPLLAMLGVPGGLLVDQLARTLHGEPPIWGARGEGWRRRVCLVGLPIAFGAGGFLYGPTPKAAVAAWYAGMFLLIALVDLEQELIPDRLVIAGLLTAPVTATVWGISPVGMVLGAVVEFGFFFVSAWVARGAVKQGDVKLGAYLGAISGFPRAMYGLFLMSLVAAAASLVLVLVLRVKDWKDLIPFAPFMVIGTALALLSGR
ncbi:MAG: A24 family peptidase [Chloroflexota bacterium]